MTGEPVSGGKDSSITTQRPLAAWAPSYSAAADAGYESSATGTDRSGARVQQFALRPKAPLRERDAKGDAKKPPRPEERDAIRRFWEVAKTKVQSMERAAGIGDYMELSNAATDLLQTLDDLWNLRKAREDDWRGILNFLQGVLKERGFESLTVAQCIAIRHIVANLGPASVDKNDVKSCIRILRETKLDPWRPLSGKPEE